ncbi:MAG: hypothetical protein U1F27_15980 [Turneriella sp.]
MHRKGGRVLVFLLPFLLSQVACRLERREDFDFSADQPLRCGIFKSYYFVRQISEEVYPDLGLVLANRKRLALEPQRAAAVETHARHCTELCEVRKDQLRLMQEAIKAKLALNEIKGDLRLLAKEVREFEAAKAEWLKEHAARYRTGLLELTEPQRALWAPAESFLKRFPPAAN